jgi:hypothetical protein
MPPSRRRIPWWAYAILWQPRRIEENLARVARAGLVEEPPNLWQLSLAVIRMWHRLVFRSDTVGTSKSFPVRPTWRARLLENRALRFPFLLAERAVAPLDLTGLASPPERLIRHLLGAHHDGRQFLFDLEILSCTPGAIDELHARVQELVTADDRRTRWLRDLTVYESYHENLATTVAAARGGLEVPAEDAADPDISFAAALRWCAAQPPTPRETLAAWRAGRFSIEAGLSR